MQVYQVEATRTVTSRRRCQCTDGALLKAGIVYHHAPASAQLLRQWADMSRQVLWDVCFVTGCFSKQVFNQVQAVVEYLSGK